MVGYMSKEGKVLHINPREDSMLEEGDSVIVLSQSRESSCCPAVMHDWHTCCGVIDVGSCCPSPVNGPAQPQKQLSCHQNSRCWASNCC